VSAVGPEAALLASAAQALVELAFAAEGTGLGEAGAEARDPAIARLGDLDFGERRAEIVFLSAADAAAARMYERLGFRRIGIACFGYPAQA
jgi:hypothetical protein